MTSPLVEEREALIERLRHLVSLDRPENGGPYGGLAAAECMKAMAEAADSLARLERERDEAREYATSFLCGFVAKYCDPVPGWRPLPDLFGVLTQLDNAITVAGALKARAEAAEARAASLQSEVERLRGALTPSAETKAAYMGEFEFVQPQYDEDGFEVEWKITVPWTTIKEIMAAIRTRAGGSDE